MKLLEDSVTRLLNSNLSTSWAVGSVGLCGTNRPRPSPQKYWNGWSPLWRVCHPGASRGSPCKHEQGGKHEQNSSASYTWTKTLTRPLFRKLLSINRLKTKPPRCLLLVAECRVTDSIRSESYIPASVTTEGWRWPRRGEKKKKSLFPVTLKDEVLLVRYDVGVFVRENALQSHLLNLLILMTQQLSRKDRALKRGGVHLAPASGS